MTWRHGSIGLCLVLVCASASAQERALDASCDRATQHVARDTRAQAEPLFTFELGAPKRPSPWKRALPGAMIGALPPSLVDVTATLGEALLAVEGLTPQDVFGTVEVSVHHIDGALDVSWTTVEAARFTAPPAPERPFRLFNGNGYAMAAKP